MISKRLMASLRRHEGFRARAYQDIRGIWTIGIGTRLDEVELDLETAERWAENELEEKHERLRDVVGYSTLDSVRKDVILEMAYWMGVGGVLRFRKMWDAIRKRDFERAAREMMDSRTGRDPHLGPRMQVLAARMRTGVWSGLPDGTV